MTACGWSGPAAASTILSWPGPVSAKSSGRPEWGKRQQELPEGEGVTLDFGDGSLLRLWEVPIRGGYTPEETFGVFVAYTYPDGETYCYDTDNLGWDRVVDSLPSAG